MRIAASTFYARHDTITPAKATVTAILANIALKVILVWGFHFGVTGVALGTSLGAWVNVGVLAWYGRRRSLLTVESSFRRALIPILVAAAAGGLGAYAGVELARVLGMSVRHLGDEIMLGFAILFGCAGYGGAVFLFRHALPLGRFTQKAIA